MDLWNYGTLIVSNVDEQAARRVLLRWWEPRNTLHRVFAGQILCFLHSVLSFLQSSPRVLPTTGLPAVRKNGVPIGGDLG